MKKKIYLFNVILVVLLSYTSASEKNENDDTESVYEDAVSSPLDLNLENKNVAEDPETTGERVPSLAEQTSRIKEHMVGWKDKPRENMMQRYIKDSPKFEKDTGVEPLGDKIVPKEDTPITDPLSLKEYSELEHLYIEEDRMDSTPLVHMDQFLNKDNITRWVEEISEKEIQEACKALCKNFGMVLPAGKITELYNNIKNYVNEIVGNIRKLQDFFENNQSIIVIVKPEEHVLIFQPMGGSAYQVFSLEDVVACYAIMPALFDKVVRQERYVTWRIKQMGVSLRERFSRISHWLFDSIGTSSYLHPRKKQQLSLTGTSDLSAKIPSRPSKGLKELLEEDDPISRSHYIHRVQIGLSGKEVVK